MRVVDQHIREGRFQRSLALIAGSPACSAGWKSVYEHYRGSYSQRVMYTPVLLSPALLVAGRVGRVQPPRRAHAAAVSRSLRCSATACSASSSISRRPSQARRLAAPVYNIMMGPPLFAPLLLGVSGYPGVDRRRVCAARTSPLRQCLPGTFHGARAPLAGLLPRSISREGLTLEQHVREGRFQKALAAATAVSAPAQRRRGALLALQEQLHVSEPMDVRLRLAPLSSVAGFGAVASRRIARTVLPLASLAAIASGGLGLFYHGRGILRRSGG